MLCSGPRTWYVHGEGVSVPDRVPSEQTAARSRPFSRFSGLEAVRTWALHEREQGKMTCHAGLSSVEHGEDEIASSDAKVRRGGNEFAREWNTCRSVFHSRSRPKTVRAFKVLLVWLMLCFALIGATCRNGQCFAV